MTAPSGEWSADGRSALLMVAVCNGPTVGGGAALAADADLGDGLLDVLVGAATGLAERVAFAAAPRAGDHAERDDVVLVRGREVRITGEAVEIDPNGEGHEDWTRQHWRIQPAAWLLLT